MATQSVESDLGVGLALVFGALATVGIAFMLVGATQEVKAWGFAAAMIAAGFAVVVPHLYDA